MSDGDYVYVLPSHVVLKFNVALYREKTNIIKTKACDQ